MPVRYPIIFVELKRIFITFLAITRYYFINNSFIKDISGIFIIYYINKFFCFRTFNINKYKELGYYKIFFNVNDSPYLIYIRLIIIRTLIR